MHYLWLLAALSAPAGAAVTPVDTVLERFNASVLFHAGFDAGTPAADLAGSGGKPQGIEGTAAYDAGLVGRALSAGCVRYGGAGNLNLAMPGTALLWISIARTDPAAAGEGYLFPLRVLAGDRKIPHGLLMVGKIDRANGCHLYLHCEASGQKHAQIHAASTLGWKAGEWHLLALTWRKGAIEFSVDGGAPAMAAAPELPSAATALLVAAVDNRAAGLRCLVDEFLVLNRPLDRDEIAWVYRTVHK